jgi:hypothetical protein
MTAAIIGLLGVVVGALLSGVASDLLERRKRRATALAAARAIATELRVAHAKFESATKPVRSPSWWVGIPVTTAWQGQLSLLAAKAPNKVVDETARAYAQIESWIGERDAANAAGATAPSDQQRTELNALLGNLETAIVLLDCFVSSPPGKRRREVIRIAISAAVVLTVFAFLTMLFLPRADVTASTVAAAVERLEGPSSFVECDRAGSHWDCDVTHLSRPRRLCGVTADMAEVAALTSVVRESNCGSRAPPVHETVDKIGNELAVHATPGSAERSAIGALRLTPESKDNLFLRVWRALWDE